MNQSRTSNKTFWQHVVTFLWMALGAFLVAVALKCFLAPARLIDGGVVGVSMILSGVLGQQFLPYFLVIFNIPFIILALKQVGKRFVIQMVSAVIMLGIFCFAMEWAPVFEGDVLEVIFFGGLILGIGGGLVIRMGGALDGTEILAIILNRKRGYTVGQVVIFINIFIFALSGFIQADWHPALRSFMTYIVAFKVMDAVIVGLEETKAAWVVSDMPRALAKKVIAELGLGVTFIYGRGGYSGDERELLYVIVERLQLSALKALVHREDPDAFIAVENLHEVIGGQGEGRRPTYKGKKKTKQKAL